MVKGKRGREVRGRRGEEEGKCMGRKFVRVKGKEGRIDGKMEKEKGYVKGRKGREMGEGRGETGQAKGRKEGKGR